MLAERREHALDHRPAAVDLQLGHVLAGLAFRGGEEQHQPLVQKLPGLGVADQPQGRNTGRGTPRRDSIKAHARGRA